MQGIHYRDRVEALEETWACWARTSRTLADDGWARPSRCAGWDVAALYAHVGMFPVAVRNAPLLPADPGTPLTAVGILRGFNAPGGVAHGMATEVADAAVRSAAGAGPDGLRHTFIEDAPRAIEVLRGHDPGDLVPWPATGGVTTWGEALRIVLLESAVHLLDVLDALDRAPDVPEPALREAAHLLAEVADPVTLVEAATGRTTAGVFPVLR